MKISCDKCGETFDTDLSIEEANNADEVICDNCLQNAAESAYERLCEDFHDGGSTRFQFREQPPRKGELK
jgi:hypothetical protein